MLTLENLKEMGMDPSEGLARCMNNEDFFFKMVKMALSNEYFETLEKALEDGDKALAFEAAHALKGVVGNLALSHIYDPLAEMTELLRASQDADYVPMYRPIKALRDKLLAMCQD